MIRRFIQWIEAFFDQDNNLPPTGSAPVTA